MMWGLPLDVHLSIYFFKALIVNNYDD